MTRSPPRTGHLTLMHTGDRSIVHPHQFRHTTVDDLPSAGVSKGGVMTIAGWKDPSMLRRYAADMAATRAVNVVTRMGDRY